MVEQPTRAVSRDLVSGVNMPTVFPNDARPVQEAGGGLNSLRAPPAAAGQNSNMFSFTS